MFTFERPQRLKVVVRSRTKFGGRIKSEDDLLGVLASCCAALRLHMHARMHACREAAGAPLQEQVSARQAVTC